MGLQPKQQHYVPVHPSRGNQNFRATSKILADKRSRKRGKKDRYICTSTAYHGRKTPFLFDIEVGAHLNGSITSTTTLCSSAPFQR